MWNVLGGWAEFGNKWWPVTSKTSICGVLVLILVLVYAGFSSRVTMVKETTFSLLRRLRIIRSSRADNTTISSAIMIFHVKPSIVFHKRLLRSNKYWANTVCTLFFSDNLWAPPFPVFMFWITGTGLAPPDVKEIYCISCKCWTGQTSVNGVVG